MSSETKHCNTCDTTKPVGDFHGRAASNDGLAAKCKLCQRAYDRARLYAPHRVAAREAYQQTDAFKASAQAAAKRWKDVHPRRRAAHAAVAYAIRTGKLVRQACEVCGYTHKVEAHHDDYDKPLDVRWLCIPHHKKRHMDLRDQGVVL